MAKDVFLSYKSEDFAQADWIKGVLEHNGISCWMAPACIPGGSNYASEIPKAIRECRVFVLVLSKKAQESIWVPKEVDQAVNEGKTVMPFMLENFELRDDFNFYLSNIQRYAAYENKALAAEKMLREIRAILNISVESQPIQQPPVQTKTATQPAVDTFCKAETSNKAETVRDKGAERLSFAQEYLKRDMDKKIRQIRNLHKVSLVCAVGGILFLMLDKRILGLEAVPMEVFYLISAMISLAGMAAVAVASWNSWWICEKQFLGLGEHNVRKLEKGERFYTRMAAVVCHAYSWIIFMTIIVNSFFWRVIICTIPILCFAWVGFNAYRCKNVKKVKAKNVVIKVIKK